VFLLLPREHDGSFEGLGLVLLEAAARGLPSVTWAMGGAPEAVVDGVTGVVVDAGDVDAAAAALASLLRDPARRRVMGEAGRAFARERSWTALAVALASRYADLARRKRGVGAAP
jgi:phosphatidylinositol alpha-1,6-mannosyltransferase